MQNVLTDLCIEAEANTLTAMKMSDAFDDFYNKDFEEDEDKKNLFRIGVTVGKYFVTKRLPNFTYECMEVFTIILFCILFCVY